MHERVFVKILELLLIVLTTVSAIVYQLTFRIRTLISQPGSSMSSFSRVLKLPTQFVLQKPKSRHAWQCGNVDPEKVLVLFFPWLGAQEKYLRKYQELYLSRGLDILTVKKTTCDVTWQPKAGIFKEQLDEAIEHHGQHYDHFLIHTMSMGALMWANVRLRHAEMNDEGGLLRRVRGIVYDSVIVDPRKVGTAESGVCNLEDAGAADLTAKLVNGVAVSQSFHPTVTPLFRLGWWLNCFLKGSIRFDLSYNDLMITRDNPLPVPTLFYASKNDHFEEGYNVEQLANTWKSEKQVPLMLKVWDRSFHVSHLAMHKQEYVNTLDKFMPFVFDRNPLASAEDSEFLKFASIQGVSKL